MFHQTIDNLISVQKEINLLVSTLKYENYNPNIIAVSKTFPITNILPLINHGHIHYGENKVQECLEKWKSIKDDFLHIKLHMLGKLQTNKVKLALSLFDYIHSLDNIKLAKKISSEKLKYKIKPKIFIQINIENEVQKSGIEIENLNSFYKICKNDLELNIVGLMCIPPQNDNFDHYFSKIQALSNNLSLTDLSIGMSGDYLAAIKSKSTFLRLGTRIFGERDTKF